MAMDMSVALKINAGVTGQQAVDQLRTSMDKLNGAATSVGRGFDMAKTAVGAFIGLQAIQGVLTFARETINAADQLDEMSERTGIAVSTLSELDFAAKMNGKSLDDVQSALNRVAVKATDAATGNKGAAVAFDALGISVKNADGSMRSSLEITEDIGNAFRQIQDPTLKAALAVEIFGKQGPTLVPLIEKLEDARKEARDLGAVVGEDFAAQAAEFNDNMDRMAFMAKGFASSILSDVLPALSDMFKEFRTGIKVFGSFGSAMWNVGTTNPFKTPLEHAKDYSAQVSTLEASIKKLDATGTAYDRASANRLRSQLEDTRKLAQYFKEISGYQEAGAGRGFINPPMVKPDQPNSKDILAKLAQANAPATTATVQLTDAQKEAARQEAERKQILAGLNDEVLKMVEGEQALTITKLRRLGASEQEIAQAQAMMTQRAQLTAADRELDQYTKDQIDLEQKAKRSKEELAEAGRRVFEETRTPAEKLNAEMVRLNDLLQAGAIDWATYYRAISQAQDDFDDLGKKGTDTMADLKSAVEGWGRQATDTFVDFAFSGKATFKDLVTSILKDIARMLIQKSVMAPLMSAVGGYFGFANGGIMTNSGPVPLNAYANGGIANSPQVALFGEGRMPEAYVPLPDGRTIPVTMKGEGGGGSTNVVVNVNVESGETQVDSNQGAELGRLVAGVVRAELINQKRPGGLLAA
jgi:lambda family phage tail tape measure protein